MPVCAKFACYNSTDKSSRGRNIPTDTSFHSFPLRQPDLLKQWVQYLGRKDYIPTKASRLCSVHFIDEWFVSHRSGQRRRSLKDGAVPTKLEQREQDTPGSHQQERSELPLTVSVTKKRKSSAEASGPVSSIVSPTKPMQSTSSTKHVKSESKTLTHPVTRAMLIEEETDVSDETEIFPTRYRVDPIMPPPSPPTQSIKKVKPESKTPTHTVTRAMLREEEEAAAAAVSDKTEIFPTRYRMDPIMPPPTPPTQSIKKLAVHSLFGTPHRTAKDHAYASKKKEIQCRSFATQTVFSEHVSQATPSKDMSSPISSPPQSEGFEDLSDFHLLPESSSSSESSPEELENSVHRKYIVFEDNLMELHNFCKTCGAPVVESTKFTRGSLVGVKIVCHAGHSYVWHSQPLQRKQPLGNLLIAAAILISGSTYAKFKSFADTLGLLFFSKPTFNKIQKLYVLPVIQESWEKQRKKTCEELRPLSPIVLAGDGRCDSPGHCAKYGSYTLMHTHGEGKTGTRKIVSLKLVQVSEVKNSNHMESEGLKRCLKEISEENLEIGVLATDRHIMISHLMKTDYKEINHQYDVWHVAKGVIKKLTAKAKTKDCTELSAWIQSISNHLWWACSTCTEDEQVLREKWLSILHHVTNNHHWSGNQKFHCCEHAALSHEDEKTIKWLKPTSPAFVALKKIITETKFMKAIGQLNKFCHTGELEVFHSMLLKFCPKRQHFHYDAMIGRLMLAALEWNSTTRLQKTDQHGKPATSVVYSKRRKTFVLRNTYEKTTEDYTGDILKRIVEIHRLNIKLKAIERPNIPRNVAPMEKPAKEELEKKFRSRFK